VQERQDFPSRTTRRPPLGAVVLVLLGCLSLLAACTSSGPSAPATTTAAPVGTGTAPAPAPGTTLRLGVTGLSTLDPAEVTPTVQSTMIAADLLFDGLTAIDAETSLPVPSLAKSVTPNEDLTIWTFPLRDATFSDGTPVTATDVKFSLERIASKGIVSLAASRLDVIAGYQELVDGAPELSGVKAVDAKTVQITTKVPYAPLPSLLGSPVYGVVPKAAVDALKADFGTKPVGSGPFAFVSMTDDLVRLKKAPGAKAKLDGIDMVRFTERAAPLQALKDGKVDWAPVADGTSEDSLREVGNVVPGAHSADSFFGFNLASPVVGASKNMFRKAVVKAIDRNRIATTILNSAAPLNGVIPPGVAGHTQDPCGDACSYDPGSAKQLVAETFPDGNVPTVEVDSYADSRNEPQTVAQTKAAEQIVEDLRTAGIPAASVVKPLEEYRTYAASSPERQLFSYGWVGLSPDADLYIAPLFLSTSVDNTTGFKVGAIDEAIAKARATADPKARADQYAEIEKQIMQFVPILPLANLDSTVVLKKTVSDYKSRLDGTFDSERVTLT
jgi:ABC-type transport system substrate-binding protein